VRTSHGKAAGAEYFELLRAMLDISPKARLGLGRVVSLYYGSSTFNHIH
jgi:hypothetical protein